MATVPQTVTSIREQIKEAIKLSIGSVATVIPISGSWGDYIDEADYPIAKAWVGQSVSSSKFMAHVDIRDDVLYVTIAPWCTIDDFEAETSNVIESYLPLFNPDAVRTLMYPTYSPRLANIAVSSSTPAVTSLSNPYAVVEFVLSIKYKITV